MIKDGPGIHDGISSMVSDLKLNRASNGKVDKEFSSLAVLFLSAARQGEDWSHDCKDAVSLADKK